MFWTIVGATILSLLITDIVIGFTEGFIEGFTKTIKEAKTKCF